jgi:hypothetical protein
MTDEEVGRVIEARGEMWDTELVDRRQVPVMLATEIRCGAEVVELTLPPGEPHPYWRVDRRQMTDEDCLAWERDKPSYSIGSYLKMADGKFLRIDYYVKNGRGGRSEWSVGGTFVNGLVESND